jgi:hypothetical protein
MQGGNVFYDLEIFPEHLNFLDGPENIKAFEIAVLAKVGELEAILEEKATPTSKIEDRARLDYKQNPAFKKELEENTGEIFTLLYEMGESLPFPVIIGLIDNLRKLAQDLENSIHDRAKRESLSMTESISDKKMAQVQHKRLRDAWQPIKQIALLMYELNLKQIASKPGNYAASPAKTYAFYFPGEEEPFYNFRVAARRLGIFVEGIKYMDVLEYAIEHPDEVEVKEVVL